jgi:hypothetical protein
VVGLGGVHGAGSTVCRHGLGEHRAHFPISTDLTSQRASYSTALAVRTRIVSLLGMDMDMGMAVACQRSFSLDGHVQAVHFRIVSYRHFLSGSGPVCEHRTNDEDCKGE